MIGTLGGAALTLMAPSASSGKFPMLTVPLTGCTGGRLSMLTTPDTACISGRFVTYTGVVRVRTSSHGSVGVAVPPLAATVVPTAERIPTAIDSNFMLPPFVHEPVWTEFHRMHLRRIAAQSAGKA